MSHEVEIFNMATGTTLIFTGISPKEALICAYRQQKGDYSSWSYPKVEDVRFQETDLTIGLGDFSYLKPEAKDPEFVRKALATRDALLSRAADRLQDLNTEINGDLNDYLAQEIRAHFRS